MNALDSVRLIQHAQTRAERWAVAFPSVYLAVVGAMPAELTHRYTSDEWVTTVGVFMEDGEAPTTAAERLAQYLLAYQERHATIPTLEAIQQHAADRHLKG